MKKTTKKKIVSQRVEIEVSVYTTSDGTEFDNEQDAERHENFIKKYPKISKHALEWIDNYLSSDEVLNNKDDRDKFIKALNSEKAIIICDYSGGDNPFFEVVEPHLVAVEAVIKVLHRKTVGCNCNIYVRGVLYLKESLCFNDGKKDSGGYYETGKGRNIKNVLK